MKRPLISLILGLTTVFAPMTAQAAAQYDLHAALYDSVWYDSKDYSDPCAAGNTTKDSTAATLSGNDHVSAAYNFFIGKGLTAEQASGIIGNMISESGIEPQRLESVFSKLVPADQIAANLVPGHLGWGIVQWTPYGKMVVPTQAATKDPNSLGVQLDFLWGQLSGTGLGSSAPETSALAAVKAATTPDAAATAFVVKYERPANVAGTAPIRVVNAIAVYQFVKNGVPIPDNIKNHISTSPVTGGSTAECKNAAAFYKNPYRDIPHLQPMRIDEGVDYGGDPGPIYAVGNGVVTSVNNAPSPATMIIYKLSDGPAAGKSIFFGKDCKPVVKVGDAVTSSTKICDYAYAGYWTQSGWAGTKYGFLVDWVDGPPPPTGYATNAGIDFNSLLVSLGVPPGYTTNADGGPSSGAGVPADWPKW
jgi:hypothetical protein